MQRLVFWGGIVCAILLLDVFRPPRPTMVLDILRFADWFDEHL